MNLLDLAVRVGVEDSASGRIGKIADGIVEKMAQASRGVTAFGVAFGNIITNVATSAWNEFMSGLDSGIARFDILNNFEAVMESLGETAEASAAAVDMIKEGLNGLPSRTQDIAQIVQQVKATGIGLQDATKITLALNDAMLAGGQGTEGAARAMDAYNKMLSVGKVDMNHWNSMVQVAPAQMNQLAESLLYAGASQNDLYEAMKDGAVTFEQFNQALMDLDEGEQGFRAQAEAATKGIQTSMENFQSRIGTAWANILEKIDAGRIADLLDSISSHFAGWGNQIGEALKPVADTFFYLSDVVTDTLGRTMQDVDELGEPFTRLATPVENLEFLIFNTLNWFGVMDEEAGDAAEAIGESFGNLLDTLDEKSGAAADALKALFDSLPDIQIDWVAVFKGIIDFMDKAASFSGDAFVNLLTRMGEAGETIGKTLSPALENIEPLLESCADHLQKFFDPIVEFMSGEGPGWETFMETIAPATERLGDALEYFMGQLDRLFGDVEDEGPAVVEVLATIPAAIIDFVAAIINIAGSLIDFVLTAKDTIVQLVDLLGRMWENGTQNLRDIWDGFVSWIKGIFENLKSKFEQLGKDFEIVPKMFQEGFDNIGEGIDSVVQWFRGLPDRILGAIGNVGGLLFDIGSSIIQGLMDGVSAMLKPLTDLVSGITSIFPENKGPIEVDRKLLYPSGQAIMGGLISGVDSKVGDLRKKLRGITSEIGGVSFDGFNAGGVPRASFAAAPAYAGATYNNWNVTLQYDASDDAKDMFEDLLGLMNDTINMGV